MALAISHGARSDVGHRRPHNEDRYCADPELGLFVVCDGMGGVNAGEVASALAIETIHRHFAEAMQRPELPFLGTLDESMSPLTNRLASAIRLANEVIYKCAKTRPDWSGMGSTVIASALTENVLSYGHVGDSRLYLIRNRTIQPLTLDHSWRAEQVRQGVLTEQEAERSSQCNLITRALGAEATVRVTLGELPLIENDLLLLCSDGLTKEMPSSMILDTLVGTKDAQTLAHRLVIQAHDAGGEDDTTVIVLAVREEPYRGLWRRLCRRIVR